MFYALLMKYVKVNAPWNRFKNTEPEFWRLLDQYQKQIESSDDPQTIADLVAILNFLLFGTLDDLEEDGIQWAFKASKRTWCLYKRAVRKLFDLFGRTDEFSVAQKFVEPLMNKCGFINGTGWWIKIDDSDAEEVSVQSKNSKSA